MQITPARSARPSRPAHLATLAASDASTLFYRPLCRYVPLGCP